MDVRLPERAVPRPGRWPVAAAGWMGSLPRANIEKDVGENPEKPYCFPMYMIDKWWFFMFFPHRIVSLP